MKDKTVQDDKFSGRPGPGEAAKRSGKGGKSGGGMGGQKAGGISGGGKRKTHVGSKKGSPGSVDSD
jgi:hypothetical protein